MSSDAQPPRDTPTLDVERVICRLSDIDDPGARGFTIGRGD